MRRFLPLLILIGLLAYCLVFQGERGLWEADEGRYTVVAMEMLRQGDWIVPHLNREQPHWTKPPLTYWAIAASVSALGRSAFAARLPSALAFFLTTCLVYLLGRLFLARRAWLAPLIYATFLLPSVASNLVTTDGLLTLWETAAVCAFAYAVWGDRSSGPTWMLVMWGAFSLAFLTKGPPGLLPLVAIIAHRLWSKRNADNPSLRWWPGLLVFLAVGLPWFILVVIREPELLRYFLVHEVYGRVVTGEHSRNSRWYKALTVYLPVLLLGTLPWTFWLARHVYRRGRILMSFRRTPLDRHQSQELFLLLWVLCPLLIFMVSSSRLPLYLLPLFAPLSLLAARGLEEASFSWNRRRLAWTSAWCVLLVAVRLIAAHIPSDKDAAVVAKAIQANATAPYSEIAFYGTDPMLGLGIYLDKEIENVSAETLNDELQEDESRLWVLRPRDAASFLADTTARGRKFRQVGRIGERYLFLQESPRAGRVRHLPNT